MLASSTMYQMAARVTTPLAQMWMGEHWAPLVPQHWQMHGRGAQSYEMFVWRVSGALHCAMHENRYFLTWGVCVLCVC